MDAGSVAVRRIWLIAGSLAYWLTSLALAGFAMVVQGDCWAGTTHDEAVACAHRANWAGLGVLAFATAFYGLFAWAYRRQTRKSD